MAEKFQVDFEANLTGNLKQEVEEVGKKLERVRTPDGSDGPGIARPMRGQTPRDNPGLLERLGGRAATEFGALGRAAVGLGAPAAGMAAVSAMSNKLATSLEVLGNSTTSFGQKQEALLKEVLPLFSTFARLRDSINGVSDSLRRLADNAERATAREAASGQLRSSTYGLEGGVFAAQATARAANTIAMPGWAGGGYDTAYSGDRIARQEAMRRYEAQANIQRARRTAMAAAETAQNLEGRASSTRTASNAARGRFNAAESALHRVNAQEVGTLLNGAVGSGGVDQYRLGLNYAGHFFGGGSGQTRVNRTSAANDLRSASEENTNRQNEAFSARQGADAAIVQQRQAEVNLQRQILAGAKEELAILDQKEARMSAVQQRLGLMTDAQFELARSAAAYIKEYGLGAATSEQITLAQSVSPDYVRRLGEERGQGRAGELANQFGTRDDFRDFAAGGESLAGVRGRQNSMGQAIAEAADRIEVQFADVMSTTVTQAFMRAIEMFADRFTQALREFEAKLAIRNAMQG